MFMGHHVRGRDIPEEIPPIIPWSQVKLSPLLKPTYEYDENALPTLVNTRPHCEKPLVDEISSLVKPSQTVSNPLPFKSLKYIPPPWGPIHLAI